MKEFNYTVNDPLGLHARPAGMLAKAAKAYPDTTITIDMWDAHNAREFSQKGYRFINSSDMFNYIVPGNIIARYNTDGAFVYQQWNPRTFSKKAEENLRADDPGLYGAKVNIWNDYGPTGPSHSEIARVAVPGIMVDYAVISPAEYHYQNFGNQPYDAALAHEFRVPVDSIPTLPMSDRKIIARRAAMELPRSAVINLGIGIPEGVSGVAVEEGFADELTMTVEAGQIGGVPAAGAAFGGAYNPEFVPGMISQFDFYDGGGLDVCFLGAAEVDAMGNCNVSKFTRTVGPGGFINIASNTPKCVFCGTLTAGGLKTEVRDGRLVILQEGRNKKYVKQVKQVTFSSANAVKSGQDVLFITERAVFRIDDQGVILTEIAPGIDLQTQVLEQMEFLPKIAPALKLMDSRIFREEKMGLADDK